MHNLLRPAAKPNPRFEVYQSKARTGGWGWRLISSSDIIEDSGERYVSKANAVRAIESVKRAAPVAPVVDE